VLNGSLAGYTYASLAGKVSRCARLASDKRVQAEFFERADRFEIARLSWPDSPQDDNFSVAAGLMADGDGLHFEMAAAEDGSYADEFASGQILGEITFVNGIEFVVVGEIGARNLDVDEIVHGESGLREQGFIRAEKIADFIFDFFGRFAGFRVKTDIPRDIQGVSDENRIAEGGLRRTAGQVDSAAFGLRVGLGERPVNSKEPGNGECSN
jgi:hypothetical protein